MASSDGIWIILLSASGVLLLLGVGVAALGLRGRRAGDHLHCRKCEYDLYGLPAQTAACPECGADIRDARARHVGRRCRRRGLIALGFVSIALGTLVGVGTGTRISGIQWQHYKPLWWLERDLCSGDGKAYSQAYAELRRRLDAGELTGRQLVRVAMMQRKSPLGGNFAHYELCVDAALAARVARVMSDAEWEVVATRLGPVSLLVRSHVRQGDPLAFNIDGDLGGWARNATTRVSARLVRAKVDGREVPCPEVRWNRRCVWDWAFQGGGDGQGVLDIPWTLAPGEHELACLVEVNVSITPFENRPGAQWEKQFELRRNFVVVSPEQQTVRLVTDPSLRDALRRCFMPDPQSWAAERRLKLGDGQTTLPVDVAFDICLRSPDDGSGQRSERHVMRCEIRKGAMYTLSGPSLPPDAASCDLVLKPSVAGAIRYHDMTEIWGEEVVYKAGER